METRRKGPGNIRFIICAVGIFVCHIYRGIIQERIVRGNYGEGENQERFTYTMALAFVMCTVNYVYALIISALAAKQERDTTKNYYYITSSFTHLLGLVTSNKALLWINYPTKVVGKSCKPIAVMIFGTMIARKKYSLLRYLFVLIIIIGVALFIFKDGQVTEQSADERVIGIGGILLLISLACNGLTGAVQERMKVEHNTDSGHMMMAQNQWSLFYLGIALVCSGEIWDFIAFMGRHPSVVWQLPSISAASALGQYFTFMCVAEFGTLPCSLITTVRKFFTVLGSVIIFGNHLTNRQWLGTMLLFTGSILNVIYGKSRPPQQPRSKRVSYYF